MQFGGMYIDVGFTFRNPLMLAGFIFACLWILFSTAFFVAMAAVRKQSHYPYSQERIILTLIFYLLLGLYLPLAVISFLLNITAGKGVHVGMAWGRPPIWVPAISLLLGIGLGLALSKWKTTAATLSGLISKRAANSLNGRNDAVTAAALSLVFPGLGQVYREQLITGLCLLFSLCFFSQMFGNVTFLIIYIACALAALLWRNDRFW